MNKSADAFRTISEVAEWLGVQTHVLRFWESKFNQVRPVKRAGGRRYYRPTDMLLLGGIRKLLHEDGLTIKGVQKVLREEGVSHVSDLSPPLDALTSAELAEEASARKAMRAPVGQDTAPQEAPAAQDTPSLPFDDDLPSLTGPEEDSEEDALPTGEPGVMPQDSPSAPQFDIAPEDAPAALSEIKPAPVGSTPDLEAPVAEFVEPVATEPAAEDTGVAMADPAAEAPAMPEIEPPDAHADASPADMDDSPAPDMDVAMEHDAPAEDMVAAEPPAAPVDAAAPVPQIIDAPDGPAPEDIPAEPGILSRVALRMSAIDDADRDTLSQIAAKLDALRSRMESAGRNAN